MSLTKRYGSKLALESLNLTLPEGGIFGFLGPNGAGKTTTIRLLLGFLKPTSGEARIFDRDCWREAPAVKRDLGYLSGDLRLYRNLTGLSMLKIMGGIRGLDLLPSGRALAERFDFNLTIRAGTMSRGTQQKLGLILALAHDPRLLILDEPTNGLDPIMQERLKEYLRELAGRGRTIFFSSHALSTVEQLCDRVTILRQGRLVTDTTLDELRTRAPREVNIVWRDGASVAGLQPPAGLEVIDRGTRAWRCRWRGAMQPLVDWFAAENIPAVDDLTISPPDLENMFQEYYREGQA